MRKLNWTTIALIGGLLLLLLAVAYFATGRNADQDKLTDGQLSSATAPSGERLCADKTTYDLIKRELFRRAAQLRGSDQAAYDKLSAYASLRMENPVMESEDSTTHAVNCSGSLSLDLPPGVAAVGGRRSLMSDVDYVVQPAADGSGTVVMLRNADPIIAPLATLARVSTPPPQAPESAPANTEQPEADVAGSQSAVAQPGPPSAYPGRPSFDCARAGTKGEIAVCSDSGLSALDVNMAGQYRRAIDDATPAQRQLLESTRSRFLAYRDRCPNRSCVSDAYVGRMREIRDIMEGHWTPPR
jgi:hypothetical protein